MASSTFQYPTICSRTLDPSNKSLRTIVFRHDAEATDADFNLSQDLQTYKLSEVIKNHGVTSGSVSYSPFQFNSSNPNTFFIPSFDVIFNGEIVTIQGQQSSDISLNRIQVPTPPLFVSGDEPARIYIVFIEMWYQALNPITGKGYYVDGTTNRKYFFPYGGVLPDPSQAETMPDDSVDPFQGLFTTERAQIQWRLNVQRVALDYDFTQGAYGFYYTGARVNGTNNSYDPGQIVYGQTSLPTLTPGVSPLVGLSAYQFTSMGGVNGDTALWRCGDGNVNNSLGTLDGYSYALPVAIVFQRNQSNFSITSNIFGCADSNTPESGTLFSGISGRLDAKLSDQIFSSDVIDTRTTVNLTGLDMDDEMRKGFVDLIMGNTKLAITRGQSPGNSSNAIGSSLDYYLAVAPSQILNTDTLGSFDGFFNGFSSDARTFYTTTVVTPFQKSVGVSGGNWSLNDSFSISLPTTSSAIITSVSVTALVSNSVTGTKVPAALLQGQIQVSGLESNNVTVTFINSLTGTAFDPGYNNLYVTLGVTYASGSSTTRKVPTSVLGGSLFDSVSSKNLPVFGVSEYQVQSSQPAAEVLQIRAINPEYSNTVLGTKIWIALPGSNGNVQATSTGVQTTFSINCSGLSGKLGGLYVTKAWDYTTGNFYPVTSRVMSSLPGNGGIVHTITIGESIDPSSTVVFSLLAKDTAQLAYNSPVMGVTQIEETVLFGNYTNDSNFHPDSRVNIESVYYNSVTDTNTIVLGANGCQIKGISGDDSSGLIWVVDGTGNLVANSVTSVTYVGGTVTIVVPGKNGGLVLSGASPSYFMFVGSILPSFSSGSSLILQIQYTPYQGEGVIGRNYEILHSEDTALITTNGTGAAPVVGISDVYPYNREVPIVTTLPSLVNWSDSQLVNDPVATFFDSNFVTMTQNNVEHTFEAPLHTNDFIPPINKDIRRIVQFVTPNSRGFSQAIPHLGFAINPPTERSLLGQNLQSTQSSISLYVDNVNGNDLSTGLTPALAKATIRAALSELPPVLRHPCTITLLGSVVPFTITSSNVETIALGDGDIRSTKQYALGNVSRVMQDEGRLVITGTNGAIISASGFTGFGDGPTSAFYIEDSRVIFNNVTFTGFTNPAIIAYSSDIDFVDCYWNNNVQAGSYVGCDSVILDGGSTSLPTGGSGHIFSQSNFTSSAHILIASGTLLGAFYSGTCNSTMNLTQHIATSDTDIIASTLVANAQLNSNISADATFQSAGYVSLEANSVILRSVSTDPFLGGIVTDSSSSIATQIG